LERRDALKALAAVAAAPAAMAATQPSSGAVTAGIEALLRRTEEIWNSQDTARLRELWDTEDPEPFYLAGEQENWFVGWQALNAYLAPPGRKVTEAIRVRFYDVKARLLAPDLAFAGYWMRTDMKLVFTPKPFGSDNRVSAVLRNTPDGWKYLCYAEAFQAPNLYMQKLFEKDVSPDYPQFYEQLKKGG
jgi:hypothetical protein